jgi:riboflavin kinase / FMN adenylyltransferase
MRSVIALGTFDGVHCGHQTVIKKAVAYAKKIDALSVAITFDPHPQQFIIPERGLKLLTSLEERKELLYSLGVDKVVVIRFNRATQSLSAEGFVKKYLVKKLDACHVFVGFDYAFGRKRVATVHELRDLGKKYGFTVDVVQPVKMKNEIIKSRLIRELISRGDFKKALQMLGHPYQISGKVIKGHGRGKGLGFPTANLLIDNHRLIPQQGVYAGWVKGKKCAINIGSQPTFGKGELAFEVYILKYKGNLLGKRLDVVLTKRLRDEVQFSDVDKLKKQIKKDILRIERL